MACEKNKAAKYVGGQARRRVLERMLRDLKREAARVDDDGLPPIELEWALKCGHWAKELEWALRGGEPCKG